MGTSSASLQIFCCDLYYHLFELFLVNFPVSFIFFENYPLSILKCACAVAVQKKYTYIALG